MITVISTGLNAPTKRTCIASVRAQVGVKVEHLYIESDPDVSYLENLYRAVHRLPPDRIVASVDGDDWLAREDVLAIVKRAYHDPAVLLTWGSYVTADGRPGCAAPYRSDRYREEPWKASHLKTFRAGLFQRIQGEDFMMDGRWIDRATDHAMMFPMLEMAGPERSRFIPDVLYVYNQASSFERNATPEEIQHERDVARRIRERPVYGRLLGGNARMS